MKKGNFETQAKEMAERLESAAAIGEQLSFLADPDGEGGKAVPVERKAGRPKGSKNKVESQMRAMLAARGMRMPEEVLAEMAGLSRREDVMILAMRQTEQLLSWVAEGAAQVGKKDAKRDWEASGTQRMNVFFEFYKLRLKVLEAILPYGLGKVTPDVNVNTSQITQIVMPGAGGSSAPVVIEGGRGRAMAPPPMPKEIVQNQEVRETERGDNSKDGRTV